MTDPYTSETAAETRQRRLEDFAGWQAERERAEMLATGTAATIRALLAVHVAEEPSVQPWRCLDAFEAARFRKRAEIAHAEWRAELDTLARAYVAALDREAAQLPLTLRGAAR